MHVGPLPTCRKGLPPGGPFSWARRARGLRVAPVLAACTAVLAAAFAPAWAQPAAVLEGVRRITLHGGEGQSVVIGNVTFKPRADGLTDFVLQLDTGRFTDHFLSMREFKCLPGGTEILCHVPYPYAQPGTVSPGNLAWLEHSLLFMFKKPSDFGAKLWNGVYWQLRLADQGLVGTPQAVDLNRIAAPPQPLDKPPFRPALRDEMPAGARWFNRLTIE